MDWITAQTIFIVAWLLAITAYVIMMKMQNPAYNPETDTTLKWLMSFAIGLSIAITFV